METHVNPASPGVIAGWLARHHHLVLDGALGTELARRGADIADPLWSARLLIENPALIREVHLDYFRAGADVATTATYQATFEGFARRGIGHDEAARLMRLAVTLALEARDLFWQEAQSDPALARRSQPLVAASVGPYGAMLADGSEYRGRYGLTEQKLMDFHRPRLRLLAASGADLLACETVPCLVEAVALARLLQETPGAEAWISFSCRDGRHVSEGQPFAECVAALDGFEAVAAIGINCTAPQHVESLVRIARANTAKPIVVYPNSGETYDAAHAAWHGAAQPGGEALASAALRWSAAGARLIGGCCRTTPANISALCRRWAEAEPDA
jgi:homocysteine S-methyltransferase